MTPQKTEKFLLKLLVVLVLSLLVGFFLQNVVMLMVSNILIIIASSATIALQNRYFITYKDGRYEYWLDWKEK